MQPKGTFDVGSALCITWTIQYPDQTTNIGHLKFENLIDEGSFVGDEDQWADEFPFGVVEVVGDWDRALPVIIDTMLLQDRRDDVSYSCEPVTSASIGCNGAIIWWGLQDFGFGMFFIFEEDDRLVIANECVNKRDIETIFRLIRIPSTARKE